jgi:hypothetical protein
MSNCRCPPRSYLTSRNPAPSTRLTRRKADAVSTSTAAAVATRTTRSRVERLPADLPDASRETRRELQPLAERSRARGVSQDDGCLAPGRVGWRARTPSTRTWPLPSTSPRKRPAGSRGVASTRTSRSCGTRQAPGARATRPSVRPVAAQATCARLTRRKADAVSTSTAAAVATRTTRSRVERLPSDLPDAARETRRELQPLAERSRARGSVTRRWMPCPWPREVASTDAEHTNLAAPEHVSTKAPGRIEGNREHTNLAVMRHAPSARRPRHAPQRPPRRCGSHVRATHTHEGRRDHRLDRRCRRDASHVRATHTHEGRRDHRLDRRCRRGANHEVPRRAPPLGPAGRCA